MCRQAEQNNNNKRTNNAHYGYLHKECAGNQKKDLYSLHITEIHYIKCSCNQKNTNFHCKESAHLYSKEWLSRRELSALRRGIHRRIGIPPGVTRSWKRNQPEEWNSAGNYRLQDEESTRIMEFRRELPAPGRGIHRKNGILTGITDS
jgi:hypothetical protein